MGEGLNVWLVKTSAAAKAQMLGFESQEEVQSGII